MKAPELRRYQSDGVARLREILSSRGAAILADEPGLGKTAQALAVARAEGCRSVLVVCPASLRANWRRESALWWPGGSVDVMSYEGAVKASGDLCGPFAYDLAVFDEAHYLKSREARRTKACLSVAARKRLYLTGTPVVNRPVELWPILSSMGLAGGYVEFGKRYCAGYLRRIGRRRVWDFTGASNTEELREILSGVMVRRLKADVLSELPAKTRQAVALDMASGESAGYRAAMVPWLKAGLLGEAPPPVDFAAVSLERQRCGLAKAPRVAALARDILEEEDALVVMAYHRAVMDVLAREFSAYSPVMVRGGMSDAEKDAAVRAFQSGRSRVFIGQLQAAGTGLTLTAARTLLFAEMDWSPGVMTQAEDRIHRIGQTCPVRIIHAAAEGSVDLMLAQALFDKQAVLDGIL
jgi:SWI/SNF-related matrix-associated actin-dependent regulator 1 of chromatin subfamily A